MAEELTRFIARCERLLELADVASRQTETIGYGTYVKHRPFEQFRSSSLSFLDNLFGTKHPYYQTFAEVVAENRPEDTESGKGLLEAVLEELKGGWLGQARTIIAAEIFADFTEMAHHLLEEGYKDPAAVMLGSVLEEHLRELARSTEVAVEDDRGRPKKADRLNADLAKAEVYGKLEQKQITAWLDLRNKAAHGHYGDYSLEQVWLFHSGLLDFMTRVSPASAPDAV